MEKGTTDARVLTRSNGERVEVSRELKILTVTASTIPDGADPKIQHHHRSTVVFEGGTTVEVKETPEEVWAS